MTPDEDKDEDKDDDDDEDNNKKNKNVNDDRTTRRCSFWRRCLFDWQCVRALMHVCVLYSLHASVCKERKKVERKLSAQVTDKQVKEDNVVWSGKD